MSAVATAVRKKGKKASVKKTGPRVIAPMPFKSLLKQVEQGENKDSLIKTAVVSGWLTDGNFFTQLGDVEAEKLKGHYDAKARKAEAEEIKLPDRVGFLVEEAKRKGNKFVLEAQGIQVSVDGTLFLTMKKRHPSSRIYLNPEDPKKGAVIFSERSTVAMIPVLA